MISEELVMSEAELRACPRVDEPDREGGAAKLRVLAMADGGEPYVCVVHEGTAVASGYVKMRVLLAVSAASAVMLATAMREAAGRSAKQNVMNGGAA